MSQVDQYRFDEVRVHGSPTGWKTLTPAEFVKMPLADRVQLLVERKIRFLLAGTEISPVEALKE